MKAKKTESGKNGREPGLPKASASLHFQSKNADRDESALKLAAETLAKNKPVIFVCLEKSPEELKLQGMKAGLNFARSEEKKALYWIDCISKQAGKKAADKDNIIRVASQLALADISVALSKSRNMVHNFQKYSRVLEGISVSPLAEGAASQAHGFLLVFHSLDPLLKLHGTEAIMRFLEAELEHLKKTEGSAVFVCDKEKCSGNAFKKMKSLMGVL